MPDSGKRILRQKQSTATVPRDFEHRAFDTTEYRCDYLTSVRVWNNIMPYAATCYCFKIQDTLRNPSSSSCLQQRVVGGSIVDASIVPAI